MNTFSSLHWPLSVGVDDPIGEVRQLHNFIILGKTQVLLYKSKQVLWKHRREHHKNSNGS